MPQLGLAMESGRIVAWLKQPGDSIKAGEVLLEVETDKATIEVEAVESGVLHVVTPAGDICGACGRNHRLCACRRRSRASAAMGKNCLARQ